MVVAIRQVLLENGSTDPEIYRAVWMDYNWNVFTIYRDTYNIEYGDLIKAKCDTLFFPGCALTSFAPELTLAAVGWLAEQGGEVGLSLMCCGMPMTEFGATERVEHYMGLLWKMIDDKGVKRVVTACPTCHYQLQRSEMARSIEVISLY